MSPPSPLMLSPVLCKLTGSHWERRAWAWGLRVSVWLLWWQALVVVGAEAEVEVEVPCRCHLGD